MSIGYKYTLRKNQQEVLSSRVDETACWARFGERLAESIATVGNCEGLSFSLKYFLDDMPKYSELSPITKAKYDKIFDQMFKGWLPKGSFRSKWSNTKPRYRTALFYNGKVSYWQMVVSSSIYRQFEDHPRMLINWEKIGQVERKLKYEFHPFTKYFIAISHKTEAMPSVDILLSDKWVTLNVESSPGHQCFNNRPQNIAHLRRIISMDSDKYAKHSKRLRRNNPKLETVPIGRVIGDVTDGYIHVFTNYGRDMFFINSLVPDGGNDPDPSNLFKALAPTAIGGEGSAINTASYGPFYWASSCKIKWLVFWDKLMQSNL